MSVNNINSDNALKRVTSAKRRDMARKLRDVRDKVTHNRSAEHSFENDLLELFVHKELNAWLASPALAILITVSISICVGNTLVFIWLSAILISKGIALSLYRQFSKIPKEQINVAEWRSKFFAAEFLHGMTWAGIFLVQVNDNAYAHFLVYGCLIITIVNRIIFASTIPSIVYAGTLPVVLFSCLNFLISNNLLLWLIAGVTSICYIYLCALIRSSNNSVLALLMNKADKDYLIAEIEEAKLFSDEARRRAEEANIAKSRFLATMSHELRTPLNAILGFSEVMKDEIFGKHQNTKYKDYATDIHASGQHLLNLINEILDLSRIEAGRYELNEESLRLSDIAIDCRRLLELKADKKNLHITEDYQDDDAKIWADERAIRQIILNLLSNAIKFTPPGGTIAISINKTEDEGLKLSVLDTGPGIPEEEIPVILTNFGQGSLAHETAEGGSGLGLPIVQGLADMHDATFNLTSELRKGTEVTITFPTHRVTQILEQIPVKAKKNLDSRGRLDYY